MNNLYLINIGAISELIISKNKRKSKATFHNRNYEIQGDKIFFGFSLERLLKLSIRSLGGPKCSTIGKKTLLST